MVIVMEKKNRAQMVDGFDQEGTETREWSWYIRKFCDSVYNGCILFVVYVTPILWVLQLNSDMHKNYKPTYGKMQLVALAMLCVV